jgi:hypothetical protein
MSAPDGFSDSASFFCLEERVRGRGRSVGRDCVSLSSVSLAHVHLPGLCDCESLDPHLEIRLKLSGAM